MLNQPIDITDKVYVPYYQAGLSGTSYNLRPISAMISHNKQKSDQAFGASRNSVNSDFVGDNKRISMEVVQTGENIPQK